MSVATELSRYPFDAARVILDLSPMKRRALETGTVHVRHGLLRLALTESDNCSMSTPRGADASDSGMSDAAGFDLAMAYGDGVVSSSSSSL